MSVGEKIHAMQFQSHYRSDFNDNILFNSATNFPFQSHYRSDFNVSYAYDVYVGKNFNPIIGLILT